MTGLRRFACGALVCAVVILLSASLRADEIWIPPSPQQDLGGIGVASNTFWPVTVLGATRLAWSIPGNLQTLQRATIAIIPGVAAGGPAALHFYICNAANGDAVVTASNCFGPFSQTFTSSANQLIEVEIGGVLGQHLGTPGSSYVAVLAYTTPATTTDHIVGLRFSYVPTTPTGVATLSANTFTGTQTAPAFVGDGSGLTNLPVPTGVATLTANVFSGTQTAPAFVGSGAGLTNLPVPAGAATLGANTFTGVQTATAFVGDGSGLTNLPVGFTVVDSTGTAVGPLLKASSFRDTTAVIGLHLGSQLISIGVGPEGFISGNLSFFYTSTDCSGTPYLQVFTLPSAVSTFDGQFYYPAAPLQQRQVSSRLDVNSSIPHTCEAVNFTLLSGEATSIDLSWVMPPFDVR